VPHSDVPAAIAELARLDRPGREFRHVVDLDLGIHRLLDEGDDIGGRNPRRAETRGDVGRAEIGRLHAFSARDIALEGRIERAAASAAFSLSRTGPRDRRRPSARSRRRDRGRSRCRVRR
jgi:hypothetical protein